MMHYKIVQTSADFPDVLLYRDRDNDGFDIVNIFACGKINDDENVFACETVAFESLFTAISFISCFDQIAAETWCKVNEIFYW